MKKNTFIALSISIIMIIVGMYILINRKIKVEYIPNYQLEDYYTSPTKNLNVNEYRVLKINDTDMIELYFTHYTTLFFDNISKAYSYLNEEAQLEQYPNLEVFKDKVSTLTNNFMEMPRIDRYEITNQKDKKIYTISDKNGNIYEFQVEAVMKYTVTLK